MITASEPIILGIIIFFVSAGALLGIVVNGGPISVTSQGSVTLTNGNQQVSFITGGGNSTCVPLSQSLHGGPSGLQTIYQHVVDLFNGQPATPICHGANDIAGIVGSVATGQPINQQNLVSNSPTALMYQTIGFAVIFTAIGLFAGLFGAGILAPIVISVGIALSAAYYFLGILAIPNPQTGQSYFALPGPIEPVFIGITASMMIYVILTILSSRS